MSGAQESKKQLISRPDYDTDSSTIRNDAEASKLQVVSRKAETARGDLKNSTEASRADMRSLVEALVKFGASDLHLKAGRPPLYRVAGSLIPARVPDLSADQLKSYIGALMSDRQARDLEERRSVDFSFTVGQTGRFRCNIYFQRGQLAAAIRAIPLETPNIDVLGVPEIAKNLVQKSSGLLIISGATGMGKTTTLAGLIQHLNETQANHILTLEDPIEFVFSDVQSTISQREIGLDTPSFEEGLNSALRQDPDVIVIGELRDRRMIEIALSAAETGHLVIATLHTSNARGTIDRIVDVFPIEAKNQVRIQLASALVGIIAQQLIPSVEPKKRVLATEVLVKSPHVEQLIIRNELDLLDDAISSSNSYYHMQTMNQSLERLLRSGRITEDVAIHSSPSPEDLRLTLAGMTRDRKR